MKKFISMLLVIVMIAGCMSVTSVFASDISITINGQKQTYDVMPLIENGRTLVPMRGIFENLGAQIAWDDATKTVTGTKGNISVVLTIGNTNAKVNGKDVTLDVPAKILEGRTLVPVRFISESLGCKVDWDADTKTVIIAASKYNMAELVSAVHRPVPTVFEKSNDLYDNYYFGNPSIEENERRYAEIKSQGEVVCTTDEFLRELKVKGPSYGDYEIINVTGQNFNKALKITCSTIPAKTTDFIINTTATPERNPGDGVSAKDVMLLAFRFRCVSGGDEKGVGTVQFQVEHPETYKKALFQTASAGSEWTVIYLPFKGVENATSIGIRPGFNVQTIELGGIEIINMGEGYPMEKFPTTLELHQSFSEDALWRKDAIERIKTVRKGDFTVIVKDKDGNVIPDAQVELDMFEHEFHIGNAFNSQIYKNENYKKYHEIMFNAGVVEHSMKWAPYEQNPDETKRQVEGAVAAGVKYMRGHTLIWERDFGSDGKTYLMPERLFKDDAYKNKEYLLSESENHIDKICAEYPDMVDWDVSNEIIFNKRFREFHGNDLIVEWFKYTREATDGKANLYYNETSHFTDEERTEMYKYLDWFEEAGVDYDAIGIQSHYDVADRCNMDRIIELYDKLRTYNKTMKVTEFSCNVEDKLQASMLRDVLILTFAEEQMDGFLMWGFWDGVNFASKSAPIYDTNWNLKNGGKVFADLVYNKWWTRDAKANTDKDGRAVINGFYGDYDVTVSSNGVTKTEMVAFHKGYDNVIEITLD